MTMTFATPGDAVRVKRAAGTMRAGESGSIVRTWEHAGRRFVSVRFADGGTLVFYRHQLVRSSGRPAHVTTLRNVRGGIDRAMSCRW